MKPKWIPFQQWEDYQNGMYNARTDNEVINKCYGFFISDYSNIFNKMKSVFEHYPNSTNVNLSKTVFNQKAWLGQAVNNLLFNATINETTKAWVLLTPKQKQIANLAAENAINEWIKKEVA